MITEISGNHLIVKDIGAFSLKDTCECGQCFRWDEDADGSFVGVVGKTVKRIKQNGNTLLFYNTTPKEFENVWREYFDFDLDYNFINEYLCQDEVMKKASVYCKGIHILKQDPWEALCSFIISQNNNIPRIKGIISRLCETFGEEIENGYYSFPSYQTLAKQSVEALAPLRSGFRAKYIIDAAKKLSSGQVDIDRVKQSNYEDGKNELMTILGVGKKVADCTLLYGFYKMESFPEDVWIKRALAQLYPNGLPENLRKYGGISQQYLFHYIRNFLR